MSEDDFVTELGLADTIEINSIEPHSEVVMAIEVSVDVANVANSSIASDNAITAIESQDESYNVIGRGIQILFSHKNDFVLIQIFLNKIKYYISFCD
eukprot:UN09883